MRFCKNAPHRINVKKKQQIRQIRDAEFGSGAKPALAGWLQEPGVVSRSVLKCKCLKNESKIKGRLQTWEVRLKKHFCVSWCRPDRASVRRGRVNGSGAVRRFRRKQLTEGSEKRERGGKAVMGPLLSQPKECLNPVTWSACESVWAKERNPHARVMFEGQCVCVCVW